MEKITFEMKIGILLALIGFAVMSYGIWLLWQIPPLPPVSTWCATETYIEPTVLQAIVIAGVSIEVVGLAIIINELLEMVPKNER